MNGAQSHPDWVVRVESSECDPTGPSLWKRQPRHSIIARSEAVSEPLGEGLSGINPEDAIRVVVLVAADLFDCQRSLADAPHTREASGPGTAGLWLLEDVVDQAEVVGATGEVGVPGERHEERSGARCGPPTVPPAGLTETCESLLDGRQPATVGTFSPTDEFSDLLRDGAVAADVNCRSLNHGHERG